MYLTFVVMTTCLIYFLGGRDDALYAFGLPALALSFAVGAVTRRKAVGLPLLAFIVTCLLYGPLLAEVWHLDDHDDGILVLVGHAFVWALAIPVMLAGVYVGKRAAWPTQG
jgi:hypothetical protein